MKRLALLSTALLLVCASAWASDELRVSGRWFRDKQERVIVLRGMNVSAAAKVPPFLPLKGELELDPLAEWGLNAIRLLFNWEAYEPEPGQYNDEYLAAITRIADAAWSRGLYVFIDLHQDGFSHHYGSGCGEGFPKWAVPEALRLEKPRAEPGGCNGLWVLTLLPNPKMHQAYGAFYANVGGVRTAFIHMWERLARHFKSHPGVVGYNLLNEPWGWEDSEIYPLYVDLERAIHAIDPSAILVLDPTPLVGSGFVRTKLPKLAAPNVVYGPHFYDMRAVVQGAWSSTQADLTKRGFREMEKKANEWIVPLLVGEFGATGQMVGGQELMDLHYDLLDKFLASGTQWDYAPSWTKENKDGWNQEDFSVVDGQGNLRGNFRPRPYPRATSGVPLSFRVKREHDGLFRALQFVWEHDPRAGVTEIAFPRSLLADGERVQISISGSRFAKCELDANNSSIICQGGSAGRRILTVRKM